jgi:hypothetical protein
MFFVAAGVSAIGMLAMLFVKPGRQKYQSETIPKMNLNKQGL